MSPSGPYVPSLVQLRPLLPELCLCGGIVATLLVPLFVRRSKLLVGMVAITSLALGTVTISASGPAGDVLAGLAVGDPLAGAWKSILFPFTAVVAVLWTGHTGRQSSDADAVGFFVPLLGATLGLSLMGSTDHLVTIILAVAMASLPSYLLAASRKRSPAGAEAALKYALYGAVTGAALAYGSTLWYGATGGLRVGPAVAAPAAVAAAAVGLLIGVGFKVAAVPVHSWCPDVFEGSPLEVTAFLSVASKGAGIVLLLRLLTRAAGVPGLGSAGVVVGTLGAVTATVGNVSALGQAGVKRLLAYSSIAQSGYLLCLLSTVPDPRAGPAVLLYLVAYALMNLGAFAAVAVVERRTGGDRVADFASLGRDAPAVAACMVLCLLSLIGLPPVAGLAAKLNLMYVVGSGGAFGLTLVVVILLNTVLSATYYFRVVRAMYFEPATATATTRSGWAGPAVLVACSAALVASFLGFGPLYSAARAVSTP